MRDFNDFINNSELVDLHLVGGEYTWFRQGARNQFSRIDRFLISGDWDMYFSGSTILSPEGSFGSCSTLIRVWRDKERQVPIRI